MWFGATSKDFQKFEMAPSQNDKVIKYERYFLVLINITYQVQLPDDYFYYFARSAL